MAIPQGEFVDDDVPTGEFVTGEFVDEEPNTIQVLKTEGKIPKEYEQMRDFGIQQHIAVGRQAATPKDKLPAAEVEIEKEDEFTTKFRKGLAHARKQNSDLSSSAMSSTAGALADIISSVVGVPASLVAWSETLKANPGNFDKAFKAFETTREWSSIRHIAKEYGKKAGMDEKEIDTALYSPNFIDSLMEKFDSAILEPLAGQAGYDKNEEGLRGFGKALLKDSVTLGIPAAGMKAIAPKRPIKNAGKEVLEGIKERKERVDPLSIEQRTQGELFPAKGEQLAFQFADETPTGTFVDETPDPFALDRAFEEQQGQLPLEIAKGGMDDMFAPLRPETDLDATSAKNPFLDETTVKEPGDPGFTEGKFPGPDTLELPKTGVLDDASATIKEANLPFKLTGNKENIKHLRTFGSLSPLEMEAMKKIFLASGKPALEFDAKGKIREDRGMLGLINQSQGGWVKQPGGNYHPRVYEFWARGLGNRLALQDRAIENGHGDLPVVKRSQWAEKASKRYIDKYLGTERDPLKDIELPSGMRWEEVTDDTLVAHKARFFSKRDKWIENDVRTDVQEQLLADLAERNPEADVWKLSGGRNEYTSKQQIENFLRHVQDYVRNHVPVEQLDRYDFVRAVKETVEQDKRQAKKMEKAQAEQSKLGTSLHKQYPDGMEWREVGVLSDEDILKTIPDNWELSFDGTGTFSKRWIATEKTTNFKREIHAENKKFAKEELLDWLNSKSIEKALALEGDMMGHCVGGYCEAVRNGNSKIFSLRDQQGKAHVTIEVANAHKAGLGPYWTDADLVGWFDALPSEISTTLPQYPTRGQFKTNPDGYSRAFDSWVRQIKASDIFKNADKFEYQIIQIKGKQNRTPIDKYVPYVQDFIREGGYVVTRDLENAKLYEIGGRNGTALPMAVLDYFESNGKTHPVPSEIIKALGKPGYYTVDEILAAAKTLEKPDDSTITYLRTFGASDPRSKWNLVPRIWSSSSDSVKRSVSRLTTPYISLKELIAEQEAGAAPKEKDIPWLNMPQAHSITRNQVPMSIGNKPSLTYFVGGVRHANASRDMLAHKLRPLIEEYDQLAGAADHRILAAATELQKSKYQQVGKVVGADPTDAQLIGLGLKETEIPAFRKRAEINKILWDVLKTARKDLDGTDLGDPVWSYHPKSYGIGEFGLLVFDKKNHKFLRVHRYRTYDEMAFDRESIINTLKKENLLQDYEVSYRADMKSFENPFANINDANTPEVVQKILAGIEEKIETRRRTFEMERTAGDINGLVQFLEDGSPDPLLRDVWNSYIKNVLSFHKNVELFKLQRELMNPETRWYYDDKPNIYNWVKEMLQDELGADIAWKPIKTTEKILLSSFNALSKGKKLLTPGQKLISGEDFVISNNLVKDWSKFGAGSASAATLLFDVPNALTNALQMPLTGVVGLPLDIVGRLKADPARLLKWTAEVNAKFSVALNELAYTKTTGRPTATSKILDDYSKDGYVRAHMFDEISEVAESHSPTLRRSMGKAMQKGKAWTNDLFIEQPTNATALLYYHLLVKDVAKGYLESAGVTPKQINDLPVVLAKSWTGEYKKWTRPSMLRKLGFVGDLGGNFVTWSANQWGRFYEALGATVESLNPKSGTGLMQGVGFAVGMWYIYSHLAGGKNAPIASTVNSLTSAYNQFKEREEDYLPDLNYFAKEYGIPEWAYPQTSVFTKAQEAAGVENPIELGGGQRFSNPVQMSTLTFDFWRSVYKTTKLMERELFPNAPYRDPDATPVTSAEYAKATERLPRHVKGFFLEKQMFARPDGTNAVKNKYNNLAYTQKNEVEIWLNKQGFKTDRQVKEQEMIRHNKIYEEMQKNEPMRIKERLLQSYVDYMNSGEVDLVKEEQISKLALKYSNLNKDYDLKQFERDVENRMEKILLLPGERIEMESKSRNIGKMKQERLLKQWERLGLYD